MNDDATQEHRAITEETRTEPDLRARIATAVRSVGPSDPPGHARLKITRVDPWSVARIAFVVSIVLGVALFVMVMVLWWVMGAIGVWDSINRSVQDVLGNGSTWNIGDYLGTTRVLSFTVVVAVVNVFLMTVGGTLAAYVYNLASALVGGVNVTLESRDKK